MKDKKDNYPKFVKMDNVFDNKKDPIVESVISQFKKRSEIGIKKYGTTLAENNTDDFLQHLKEELMDGILYLEKLQQGS
jgi:hypothetical protein